MRFHKLDRNRLRLVGLWSWKAMPKNLKALAPNVDALGVSAKCHVMRTTVDYVAETVVGRKLFGRTVT